MARDYSLQNELYRQTVWFIKQYETKKVAYNTIYWSFVDADGQPRPTTPGNPTQSRGIRAVKLAQELKAIEDALNELPEYYRKPVLSKTIYGKRYKWPTGADRKTFYKYKQMFIYFVARNLDWIY